MKMRNLAGMFACGLAVAMFGAVPVFADAKGVVNDSGVNVRSASSISSDILITLEQGKDVTVKKTDGDFFQVVLEDSAPANPAYISTKYIDIKSADAAAAESGVNIRQTPDTSAAVVGKLYQGDTLTVTGKTGDWFAVTFQGVSGFVMKDYITGDYIGSVPAVNPPAASAAANPAIKYVIGCDNGLNMRKDATTTSGVVCILQNGEAVQVLTVSNGWAKVSADGFTGYVSTDFLTDAAPAKAAKAGAAKSAPAPSAKTSQPVASASSDNSSGSGSKKAQQIISYAKQFIGTPYHWGGTSLRSGCDCSGFIYSVFRDNGISLDRSSCDMVNDGARVSKADLQPGDLVFFDTNGSNKGRISHVGMYIGGGNFIESSSSKAHWGVTISSLSSDYYSRTYVTAARVIKS